MAQNITRNRVLDSRAVLPTDKLILFGQIFVLKLVSNVMKSLIRFEPQKKNSF